VTSIKCKNQDHRYVDCHICAVSAVIRSDGTNVLLLAVQLADIPPLIAETLSSDDDVITGSVDYVAHNSQNYLKTDQHVINKDQPTTSGVKCEKQTDGQRQ